MALPYMLLLALLLQGSVSWQKEKDRSPHSEALQFALDSCELEKFAMKAKPHDRHGKSHHQNRARNETTPVHAAPLQVMA
jgi:hypothetical protein